MSNTALVQLLAVARHEIGQSESPAGSNRQKYGAWYGMNGVAWCAEFVSWCANQAGLLNTAIPKHAYTPAGAQWFKDRGQWGSTPRVGAVVYYDLAGLNRISHVGLVEFVNPDGSWLSIEGNTNGAGSRTGGQVWRQHRTTVGKLGGFGYPKYPAGDPAAVSTLSVVVSQQASPAAPAKTPIVSGPSWPGVVLQLTKPRMKTHDVMILQDRLNEHLSGAGEPKIGVDGVFGPDTDRAVRWYQTCRHGAPFNLSIDGEVGPATWKSLWA